MNHDTNRRALPSLVEGALDGDAPYLDNVFAQAWKQLKVSRGLLGAGFRKRSGIAVTETVFVLLLWKWLHVSSIAMFCRTALEWFSHAKKDVLYDFLKREDVHWREFNLRVASQLYRSQQWNSAKVRAYVLDDSIRPRRGKKMEGVSSHYDHVTHRHVMGHQVVTLGLATEEAFVPLDSQIYVSQTKAVGLRDEYRDGRSIAAKRYREGTTRSKPEIATDMLSRAVRKGLQADYLVADAWYGTKTMLRAAEQVDVCAVLRMKKNKMKYRITQPGGETRMLNAKELYGQRVKTRWEKVRGLPWKAASLEVDLDLSSDPKAASQWCTVRLWFVRGLAQSDQAQPGKKDWALFLCTDPQLSASKVLQVYALRWGIEVYFKEAKQHLGLLSEQTSTFASYTASIHLCAIRYLILVHVKLEGEGARVGQIRERMKDQLNTLSFAGRLWQIFRALISGTLHGMEKKLGCSVEAIMQTIDNRIQDFFVQSLQLDTFTMRLEHD